MRPEYRSEAHATRLTRVQRRNRQRGADVKRALLAVVAVALVAASAAYATKPGSGSSMGTALVFASNPVQDLGIQTLTDQKDAASAVPVAAYHSVALTDLDGSGYLSGKWAVIRSETGSPAYSPTNTFMY